jgi:DNA-nicking Smr family endonuclease
LTHLTDEDKKLFRQEVNDVKVFTYDGIKPERINLKPVRRKPINYKKDINDNLSNFYDGEVVTVEEELLFRRAGIQHSVIRKLKRGYYSIEAELDLHGLIVTEARAAVATFLYDCYEYGCICACIIHGKGYGANNPYPILKNKLNNWLQQHENVLAFCSAKPEDGGTGAVYVLLKKYR